VGGRRVGVLSVTAAALGCGSGGPASSSSSGCDAGCWQPTAADEQFISELCDLVEPCCVVNGLRAQADPGACQARFRRAGVSRDQVLRADCLHELRLSVGSGECVPEIWDLEDNCVRAVYEPSGPQAPGQPCASGADCAGAAGTITVCTPDPSSANLSGRICMRMNRGKAGEHTCLGAVNPDGVIVAAPFYRGSVGGPPVSTGAVCARRDGLYCVPADDPVTSACATLLPGGSPCAYAVTCASAQCLTPSFDEASGSNPGACLDVVGAGTTCYAADARASCNGDSYCDSSGVCAAKLATGSVCSDDGACESGNCTTAGSCSPTFREEEVALLGFCGSSQASDQGAD
jgi:hypothetical protein